MTNATSTYVSHSATGAPEAQTSKSVLQCQKCELRMSKTARLSSISGPSWGLKGPVKIRMVCTPFKYPKPRVHATAGENYWASSEGSARWSKKEPCCQGDQVRRSSLWLGKGIEEESLVILPHSNSRKGGIGWSVWCEFSGECRIVVCGAILLCFWLFINFWVLRMWLLPC